MVNVFRSCRQLYLCVLIGYAIPATVFAAPENYVERWNSFQTQLVRKEKSFQQVEPLDTAGSPYELVKFDSDGLVLQALLDTRNIEPATRHAAVVYLHGGFALRLSELRLTQPFTDAGFVVFAPSWRGENGNPGYFECFLGEVRDAKAAIRWLSNQEYVDRDQIYVFGWSVGGGIALNLALHDDIPVKLSGSSAGLYDLDLIRSWATEDDFIKFPYNYLEEQENFFRLPLYHLQDMVRPHYAYVGTKDDYSLYRKTFDALYPDDNTRMRLIEVPGGHEGSVPRAVSEFIRAISEHP